MDNELKPYDEYKDSNINFLEKIPKHWKIYRNKAIFKEINLKSDTGSEELLSLSQYTGVTKRKSKIQEGKGLLTNAETLVGYKKVDKEDLVMNIMLAWNGSLAVSKYEGIISPAYCIYRISKEHNPYYFHYLLRTDMFTSIFKTLSTGVIESRLRLYPESFFRLYSIVPPRDEQNQIVKYLNFQVARISKFIKAKKKLIAALKEQKQVVINEAITKGINQSVKMKPSGIDWLGDIPEHWEIKRAKNYLTQTDKRSNDGTEQLLTVSHITGVTPRSEKNVNMFMAESTEGYKICEKDMIAVNTMWAWMGALGVSNYYGIISPSYHTYRIKYDDIYESEYLDKLLRTSGYIYEYYIRSTGIRSSRLRLYPDKFLEIFLVRPPLEEQKEISKYINQKLEVINGSIYIIEKEIELITEYRTSLISDVVTGKVDVSNIKIDEIIDEYTEDNEIEVDEQLENEETLDIEEE